MTARLKFRIPAAILFAGTLLAAPAPTNSVTAVRFWSLPNSTRVVVETSSEFEYKSDRVADPDRLFFDLLDCRPRLPKDARHTISVNTEFLKQIRVAETQPGVTRVVFDLGEGVEFSASRLTNPSRLIVDIRKASSPPLAPSAPVLSRTTAPEFNPPPPLGRNGRRLLVLPALPLPSLPVFAGSGPAIPRLAGSAPDIYADIRSRTSFPPPPRPARAVVASVASIPRETELEAGPAPKVPPAKPAGGTASPAKAARLGTDSQSMTRVLGLKVGRIVLDPGHGGHDTGTIGPGGLLEKDLVLDVCKRLATLIQKRLGAEVVFTRTDDTFIALERRTELANEYKADLFLSVHANSSPQSTASGVETFYLNFTSDKAALEVATRENASSQKAVHELKDLVQKIALQDKIEESREFAARVQQALYIASLKSNARTRNRGVKKAPFVVLIGASMPSVLAEIGFVSNPRDEALFKKNDFRQKIAEGLYRGISQYASTLSHFQVARN